MKKISFIKRFIACTASAVTMVSGVAANTVCNAPVSAASDYNYGEALAMSLYFFDANQCGLGVDANPLTWRKNCHTYDAEGTLNSAHGLSDASKNFIKNANGSDKVDVSGGYHDAGDHIKFSVTMGFAATSLAWSYFTYPESYKENDCEGHLMDILKETCDYLMKVTYLDDNGDVVAFCYQVAGDADHSQWQPPETQSYDRETYWADSSHPSAHASGQMASALASSSLAFRDKDSAYADKCLKYAKALSAFTQKYPSDTYDGIGSFYPSGGNKDDQAWADLWCALASNNGTLPSSYTPKARWNGESYDGDWDGWLYSWDKVWSGYAALLVELGYDTNTYSGALEKALNGVNGGLSTGRYNDAGGWGASRYNCALQNSALHLAAARNSTSYEEAAKYQMDFILGNNPSGKSFLLGYGETWPTKIHHRAANPGNNTAGDNSDAKYTIYGCLVGGPNASGAYEDNKNSYTCTEPALDYNGCFALACAGLYKYYGGDASALSDIIKNAPEIDENHVFGASFDLPQQPTTEPDTEPSTEPDTEPSTEPDTEPTTEPNTTEAPPTTTEGTQPSTEDNTNPSPAAPTLLGDTSCNGSVGIEDVVRLNTYLLDKTGSPLESTAFANSDVDKDGDVTLKDSGIIVDFIAQVISNF